MLGHTGHVSTMMQVYSEACMSDIPLTHSHRLTAALCRLRLCNAFDCPQCPRGLSSNPGAGAGGGGLREAGAETVGGGGSREAGADPVNITIPCRALMRARILAQALAEAVHAKQAPIQHALADQRKKKNYVEFWNVIPIKDPFRLVLSEMRDRLFHTREVLHQCLMQPTMCAGLRPRARVICCPLWWRCA